MVDDEPELLRMIGQTLGAAGFTAVGAASGERALELASQQEFDAALVDKNLAAASTAWRCCAAATHQ